MKNFLAPFLLTFILMLCFVSMPTILFAQDSTGTGGAGSGGDSFGDFLKENWGILLPALLVFVEAVIRLTPSEQDNSIFNFIKRIIDAILPNKASKEVGGGRLGFMPPKDATTCNVALLDRETGKILDPTKGTPTTVEGVKVINTKTDPSY
jgi:hypothetical protein